MQNESQERDQEELIRLRALLDKHGINRERDTSHDVICREFLSPDVISAAMLRSLRKNLGIKAS